MYRISESGKVHSETGNLPRREAGRGSWVRACAALAVLCLAGAGVARAEDVDAQRKELEGKRTELRAKAQQLRDKIADSDAVKDLRKDAEKAKANYEKKLANDGDLAKAREAVKTATADLSKLIAAKVAASSDVKDSAEKRQKLVAQRRELLFKQGLLEIQLTHAYSPVKRALDADKEVVQAREALAAAEADLKEKPSAGVTAARAALAKAGAALAEVNQKIEGDRKAVKAAEKVKERQAALKEARADDDRPAKAAEAEKAYAAAREEALGKIRAARDPLDELKKIAEQMKELEARRQPALAMLDLQREALRGSDDGEIAAARGKLEAAEKALAKAQTEGALGKALERKVESEKTYDETLNKLFGKDEAYQGFLKEGKDLTAKLAEIKGKVLGASRGDAKKLAAELVELQAKIHENFMQARALRMKSAELDKCYGARAQAGGELKNQVAGSKDGAEAMQAVKAAEQELKRVVEQKLAGVKSASSFTDDLQETAAKLGELRYRRALAEYELSSPNGEVAPQLAADAGVSAKYGAWQTLARDARENLTSKVASAAKKLAEVQADQKTTMEELEKDAGYAPLAEAKRAGVAAEKKAEAADPRQAAVAAAKKAAEAKRAERLAEVSGGKKLLDQKSKNAAELTALEDELKKLGSAAGDVEKKIRGGQDEDVVKARKAVVDAQKAAKDAENSEKLVKAKQEADAAQAAIAAKQKELLASDKDLQAVEKDLGEVEKKLKALGRPKK